MRRNRKTGRRYIGMVVLSALLLMGSTYAFTAANTVPPSQAGSGAGTVSGYTVSNIHYTLSATPTSLASLGFNVGGTVAAGSSVKVNAGSSWDDCTAGIFSAGVTPITCSSVTGTVVGLTSLQVVVAD